MKKTVVNARGDACPLPVVKATRALRAMTEPGELEVLVDNEVALQNLLRMAGGNHLEARTERREGGALAVTMTVTAPLGEAPLEEPSCVPDARGSWIVAVDADTMGRGSDQLGQILMKSFLFALGQLPTLPGAMLFYNGGAKLTCAGSPALEDLKKMEAQGVEILTCGTCLDFYGLKETLSVGGVTNMYEIVERLAGAGKVVRP